MEDHGFLLRKNGLRKSWVTFKGKRIELDFEPRKGICSKCHKIDNRTHLHHTQYDESDPLRYTVELCASCHGAERRKKSPPCCDLWF